MSQPSPAPTDSPKPAKPKAVIALKRETGQPEGKPKPKIVADSNAPKARHVPPPLPQPKRKRAVWAWVSFMLAVAIPGLLAAWYWLGVAEERYVTTAGFVVRAVDEQNTADMMGGLTGLVGPTSTSSDTAIVLAFLESRDLVERVSKDVDLRAAWGEGTDPLYRLQDDISVEDLVDYWTNRVVPTHDTTTGLVSYEVQAFDAQNSLAIAQSILEHSGDLVNRLSERARADALRASQEELVRAEERLRTATEAQRAFRDEAGALNPLGSAEASVALIAEIEAQLSDNRRRQSQLTGRVLSNAPQLEQLRVEEKGLIDQVATLRSQSGGDAALIARFEALELDKQFAQQSYASALAALEAARLRAESAQRYLAVFAEPQLAERAILPTRWLNTFLSVVALFALWSIGALLVSHIRDKTL